MPSIIKNKLSNYIIQLLAATAIALSISSCSGSLEKQTWYVDGKVNGTINIQKIASGFEYSYLNNDNLEVRFELRDYNRDFQPGACIYKSKFNDESRLIQVQWFNSKELPFCCGEGWCIKKISYEELETGDIAKTYTYFDETGQPVINSFKFFACKRVIDIKKDFIKDEFFYDKSMNSCGASVDGISGVARIKYSKVAGANGEATYGIYYSVSGSIIKKQVVE